MNTIHSSSLAFYPTGHIKPEPDRFEKNQVKPVDIDAESVNNQNTISRAASTPEQIRTALESLSPNENNNHDLPGNSRTAKALMAYTETRNQPMQTQLSASLSRVDLYV